MIEHIETATQASEHTKHLPIWVRGICWLACFLTGIFLNIPFYQWVTIVLQWLSLSGGIMIGIITFYKFLIEQEVIEKNYLKEKINNLRKKK